MNEIITRISHFLSVQDTTYYITVNGWKNIVLAIDEERKEKE